MIKSKPVAMGVAMAPMMLWMLHGAFTGSEVSGVALIVFVAAHVLLFGIAALCVIFAARLSPRFGFRAARLHRPSLAHLASMGLGMGASATAIHFAIHGVI